jgi:hypothetical protein
MAAAINQGQNLSDANIAAERLRREQLAAAAAVPVVVTGGVAVAGGGVAGDVPVRPKLKLKLKPEAIARARALAEAAAAAAPSGGETTESESPSTLRRRGAAGGGAAASVPQQFRAAEIRKQVSAAADVPQKSIKFAKGKGSRKAVSGVDWVATIADLKRRGLTGAAAIEAIKQKHSGVLE